MVIKLRENSLDFGLVSVNLIFLMKFIDFEKRIRNHRDEVLGSVKEKKTDIKLLPLTSFSWCLSIRKLKTDILLELIQARSNFNSN